MRHAKKRYKLGRTAAHRKATLASLSVALIQHKKIKTTITKAKALRIFVEPLITRARTDTSHNRREVFRHLQDKAAVTELFNEISQKVGDRPGGYTRVVRMGKRYGDAAEMAVIELVDYNESVREGGSTRRRRTRRSRRRRGSAPVPVATSTSQIDSTLDLELDEDLLESISADQEENLDQDSELSNPSSEDPIDHSPSEVPDDEKDVVEASTAIDEPNEVKEGEPTGEDLSDDEEVVEATDDVATDVSAIESDDEAPSDEEEIVDATDDVADDVKEIESDDEAPNDEEEVEVVTDDVVDDVKEESEPDDENPSEEVPEVTDTIEEGVSSDPSLDGNVTEESVETVAEVPSSSKDVDESQPAEKSDADEITADETTPPAEEDSGDTSESNLPDNEKDQPTS